MNVGDGLVLFDECVLWVGFFVGLCYLLWVDFDVEGVYVYGYVGGFLLVGWVGWGVLFG